MAGVMLHISDCHVLEQTLICSYNVSRPSMYLSSVPLHLSGAPVHQPLIALWEEVQTHVQQAGRREFVCNSL